MSNSEIRDPKTDHLITPENSALIVIDYQPLQINSINSMLRSTLVRNIEIVTQMAMDYKIPVILSTVRVKLNNLPDTIPSLRGILQGVASYDRTSINAWEDQDFYKAVIATRRKKLLMTALWTEACLSFPTLDAMKEGFEVYPIVDAVGGTSVVAHEAALRRVEQAGAKLCSVAQLACEIQRDWIRKSTAPFMQKALENVGAFLEL